MDLHDIIKVILKIIKDDQTKNPKDYIKITYAKKDIKNILPLEYQSINSDDINTLVNEKILDKKKYSFLFEKMDFVEKVSSGFDPFITKILIGFYDLSNPVYHDIYFSDQKLNKIFILTENTEVKTGPILDIITHKNSKMIWTKTNIDNIINNIINEPSEIILKDLCDIFYYYNYHNNTILNIINETENIINCFFSKKSR